MMQWSNILGTTLLNNQRKTGEMQPNGQIDINMVEATIKTTPQKLPSSLYPNVVMISHSDGQAQGKDTVTDLSPDEEKVRDIRPKINILPQLDGPTDPSSDEEWIERGNSPITKGKNKRKTKRRKSTKSPNLSDLQDDINSSENGNGRQLFRTGKPHPFQEVSQKTARVTFRKKLRNNYDAVNVTREQDGVT
ncbi:hypothetical protein JTB14_037687 [Gonioctena quinquepunctata]|nr:hypothetical protein JTB14_037687 [Gonioctena quinquepunctata]